MRRNANAEYKVEAVTPTMAQHMLDQSASLVHVNRSISWGMVDQLKNEILNDNFFEEVSKIIIDSSGRLLNGNHTCHAIVAANKTVYALVTRNARRRVVGACDVIIKKRTAADAIEIDQQEPLRYKTTQAAVCNLLAGYKANGGHRFARTVRPISFLEMRDLLSTHTNIEEAAAYAKRCRDITPAPGGLAFAKAKIEHTAGIGAASEFFEQFETGIGIRKGSPVLALRNKMTRLKNLGIGSQRNASARNDTAAPAIAWYVIRAWNAYALGEKLTMLKTPQDTTTPIKPKRVRAA